VVFAANINNSNITLAVFNKDENMVFRSSIASDRTKCPDEYVILLQSIFDLYGSDPRSVKGAVISSVVPPLLNVFQQAVIKLLGCKPMVVGPGIKTGLDIKIDHHSQLGTDLVANTVAAVEKYKAPLLIVDSGTAITLTMVNARSELCGVTIIPGMKVSLDALSANAAELPYISLDSPRSLFGTNTIDAMNSGIIYGTASMLDGLIDRICNEYGNEEILTIIITGEHIEHILPHLRHKAIYDPNLILEGLQLIYRKNQKKKK
jgi:type III pantothenate kinase